MYKYNPITGKMDLVNPETPEFVPTDENLKPPVTVPTSTIYHNASIPSTDAFVCITVNFGVKSRFFGTFLDTNFDNSFWNWTTGFHLIRRSGIGARNILLGNKSVAALPSVHVQPMGDGTAILVADLSGVGGDSNHFVTTSGEKFPVYHNPNAGDYPQLRAAPAGTSNFNADFGSDMVVPYGGNANEFKIFSQNGALIKVTNDNTRPLLHLDGSHILSQNSGSAITVETADLTDSISQVGQYRFPIYVNESNDPSEYLEHDSPFLQQDIEISFESSNFNTLVKYNPNAADGKALRFSALNSRIEANLAGASNLTIKASTKSRPDQEILGS
jgi:hypothetical protein